jgi:glutamyl-tRNA synthetase
VEWTKPFLAARGLSQVTLADAARDLDYYFREPPEADEKAVLSQITAESKPRLAALASMLEAQAEWSPQPLETAFRSWVEAQGLQLKDVAQPLRVAITGRTASPPLFDVMCVLGRERSLARLRHAAG